MKKRDVLKAWGKILTGNQPSLSIETTRECPLRCPGCYAYEPEHLQGIGQDLRLELQILPRRHDGHAVIAERAGNQNLVAGPRFIARELEAIGHDADLRAINAQYSNGGPPLPTSGGSGGSSSA